MNRKFAQNLKQNATLRKNHASDSLSILKQFQSNSKAILPQSQKVF